MTDGGRSRWTRARLLLWSMLLLVVFAAVPDGWDSENPLLPVQSRHQHSRARATRAARPDLDHLIEHVDGEFASEFAVASSSDGTNRPESSSGSEAAIEAVRVLPLLFCYLLTVCCCLLVPKLSVPRQLSGRSPPAFV
jgi:hypothetical protein